MSIKKKYSQMWLHFDDEGEKRAKCKYCKSSISYVGGSMNNLKRHLKVKHPSAGLVLERKVSTSEWNFIFDYSVEKSDQPSTSASTIARMQSNGSQFSGKTPKRKIQRIDKQVLRMVTKGYHSLRIVDEPEFKKLIEAVSQCPGYTLPTRKNLSNNILLSEHAETLEKVKLQVRSSSAVCLTTDCWTSSSSSNYLTITAHFIDDETILRSHLLACDEYDERYTAENLLKSIRKVATEFEISNKIIAVVSDNAANITEAILKGGWRIIGCFTHSLNLIVQAAIAETGEVIVKVKRIAEYFHKNPHGLKLLQETLIEMNIPDLKLKPDDPCRWNTTYEMLQRVIELKDAVIATLSFTRADLSLTLEEWDLIEDMLSILKPFYEITIEMSAENYVTLSKVMLLYNLLDAFISKCHSSNHEIKSMLITIQREIHSRFANIEVNNLYAESTLLDPRFKRKGFKNDGTYELALQTLKTRLCDISLPNSNENRRNPGHSDISTSIWSDYDQEFNNIIMPDNTSAAITELEKYINDEYLDRKKDPLAWWKERKTLYPRLYIYALNRLCLVATSVPCDRIFSSAGKQINERRALLKSKKVSRLVFLHNNM